MATDKSWYSIKPLARSGDSAPRAAEVSIHDEIGMWGIRFKDFARDLKALGALDEIHLSINSYGGEVLDGIAIYNALRHHSARVNVRVEGIAASIASVIAMAGDSIEIPENAYLMIHNPWGLALGDADEMRKTADLLDKMRGSIVSAYREKSGMEDDEIIDLMDAETWMTGAEAVEKGFADSVLGSVALAACAPAFDTRQFSKTPRALMKNSAPEEAPAKPEQVESTTPSPQEGAAAPVESTTTPEPGKDPEGTETPAAQAGLLQRLLNAFSGDTAIRAELETVRAQVTTLTAERDTALAKVTDLEAQLTEYHAIKSALEKAEQEKATAGQQAAALIASQGFTAEKANDLPESNASASADLAAQYNAAPPAERSKLLRQHGLIKILDACNAAAA